MASKVFISYRRDDSAGHAGRVHDRLEREFGRDLLFMDVDAIPLGADFVDVLTGEVAKCDVLLAILGPGWIDARDEAGGRRLDSEHDFVRIEIATALKRGIPVIPILLDGTRIPRADQLPADLQGLVRRNGLDVRHVSFHSDMDKLVRSLKGATVASPQSAPVVLPQLPQFVPAPPAMPQPIAAFETELRGVSSDPELARKVESGEVLGLIAVDVGMPGKTETKLFTPGGGKTEWFKDFDLGPEMVVVPGNPAFAIGRFALTFDEWDAAQAHPEWQGQSGIGPRKANDHGWGRGRQPVIDVSWQDAQAYCKWLSKVTSKTYRLPSEAEWEYCCRAETTTEFWWGNEVSTSQANYDGKYTFGTGKNGEYRKRTVPVDSFEANPWGLFQVHGNVWEWCVDTYKEWSSVLRGGSWSTPPVILLSAYRDRGRLDLRGNDVGFRLARTL